MHGFTICIGGICVPLHLLIPALIILAHQKGYLKWLNPDWVRTSKEPGVAAFKWRSRTAHCALHMQTQLFFRVHVHAVRSLMAVGTSEGGVLQGSSSQQPRASQHGGK